MKMGSTGKQCSRSESVTICTDPDLDLDPVPDPSINKQKIKKSLDCNCFQCFVTSY
jgi:hypothetical protein